MHSLEAYKSALQAFLRCDEFQGAAKDRGGRYGFAKSEDGPNVANLAILVFSTRSGGQFATWGWRIRRFTSAPSLEPFGHRGGHRGRWLRDDARAQRSIVDRCSTRVRDNADVLPCGARAGRCFSGCELYSATVWEFDIAPDKWSATFKHILSANRKARWQARVAGHC